MGYEEQLSAAKFRAERDLARQECERLRSRLRDSVPREAYERKRAAWLRQIRECEAALRKRREHIKKLENAALERRTVREEDREAAERDLARQELYRARRDAENMRVELCSALVIDVDTGWSDAMAELDRRLMPEGYEWPRYESGEPLRYEDRYVYDGREREVWHVDFDSYGEPTILNKDGTRFHPDKGERVKRPAPKVLDAEGNRIEPAMDVWWICEGDERGIHAEKLHVESIGEDGLVTCRPFNGGTWVELEPSELYVNKPVPAADGKPLLKHETVYEIETGERYFITNVFDGMTEPDFPGHTVACRRPGDIVTHMFRPSQLTHERPVADTWERLEEDANDLVYDIGFHLGDYSPSDFNETGDSVQDRVRDIVRRAKKLAGVE